MIGQAIAELVGRRDPVDDLERELLPFDQVDMPLIHRFAPNVYMREIYMPKGTLVIGHRHVTKHFNIVLTGSAIVSINGAVNKISAPYTFVSEPGDRKVLWILEHMIFQTIHPNEYSDVCEMSAEEQLELAEKLEEGLIVKTEAWLDYHRAELEEDAQKIIEYKS